MIIILPQLPNGTVIVIKDTGAEETVTIIPLGGTVDGEQQIELKSLYGDWKLTCDGKDWYLI
jgi:hypothetical protein